MKALTRTVLCLLALTLTSMNTTVEGPLEASLQALYQLSANF